MDAERHYHRRMREFEGETVVPGGIVMLGSSHVEQFDAAVLLPSRRVVNRGIACDRLDAGGRGVLHRLDVSVFACRPSAIVFESGGNDLGELWRNGRPAIEEIVAAYRRVVEAIRGRLPEVPLLLVGSFPTRGRYAGMAPLVPVFNAHLPVIAAQYGCDVQVAYSLLVDPMGELAAESTEDGLHLNQRGYRVWGQALRGWLDGLFPGSRVGA